MPVWLKDILKSHVTDDKLYEEIDKKVDTEIGKGFVAREDFNVANEAKKKAERTIKERDKKLEELKKADPEKLQAEITRLQGVNTTAQSEYDEKLKKTVLGFKLDTQLIKEGAVNVKAVRALLDESKITLDGDNLIGLNEQLKAVKDSDKWAFTPVIPPKTGLPQGGGSATEGTVADSIRDKIFGK